MSQRQREAERAANRRAQVESTQQRAAVSSAVEQATERAKNPDFTDTFTEADLDTPVYDWLEDELGPASSKVHALAYRGEEHPEVRRLLNRNFIERIIAQRSPARQLRQHPLLNYIAQGKPGTLHEGQTPGEMPEYRAPINDRKKEALRQAAEALTAHQSRAAEGRGIDAVAKVQTESKTIQEDSTKGVAGSVSEKLFGGG